MKKSMILTSLSVFGIMFDKLFDFSKKIYLTFISLSMYFKRFDILR